MPHSGPCTVAEHHEPARGVGPLQKRGDLARGAARLEPKLGGGGHRRPRFGADRFGAVPFGAVPFVAVPFGAVPFGAVPFGAVPFGVVSFRGVSSRAAPGFIRRSMPAIAAATSTP